MAGAPQGLPFLFDWVQLADIGSPCEQGSVIGDQWLVVVCCGSVCGSQDRAALLAGLAALRAC